MLRILHIVCPPRAGPGILGSRSPKSRCYWAFGLFWLFGPVALPEWMHAFKTPAIHY
jgi:hypothetical protein